MGENGNEGHAFGVCRVLERQRTAAPVPARKQGDDFREGAVAETGVDGGAEIELHSAPTVPLRAAQQHGLSTLPVPEYGRHIDESCRVSVQGPTGDQELG